MAARLLPLQPFTFSLGFSTALSTLSLSLCSLSLSVPFYRQQWCHNSSSSSTKVAAHGLHHFVNGWCNHHWQWQPSLIRVGCISHCPLMANPNNHLLWHLYGQLSSCFFSTSLHPAALPSLLFWERLWPSLQVLAPPFNHQSYQSTPFLTQKDHYNQMVCHFTSEEW
jgi:hypothetical protein